ncbi:MAG: hypothetical protein QOH47_1393 [Sphingomonadales bacterium]|jgi:hypothetical protein|nr:hypothetical protein [Sphingomonadales bacterium]
MDEEGKQAARVAQLAQLARVALMVADGLSLPIS